MTSTPTSGWSHPTLVGADVRRRNIPFARNPLLTFLKTASTNLTVHHAKEIMARGSRQFLNLTSNAGHLHSPDGFAPDLPHPRSAEQPLGAKQTNPATPSRCSALWANPSTCGAIRETRSPSLNRSADPQIGESLARNLAEPKRAPLAEIQGCDPQYRVRDNYFGDFPTNAAGNALLNRHHRALVGNPKAFTENHSLPTTQPALRNANTSDHTRNPDALTSKAAAQSYYPNLITRKRFRLTAVIHLLSANIFLLSGNICLLSDNTS